LVAVLIATSLQAQFGAPLEFLNQKAEVDQQRTQRWKTGIILEAATGPCANIFGTFSVPVDWPEQDVKVVEEVVSDTVRQSEYRNLEDGLRQMVFVVSRLEPGEKAEVLVTYEITRRLKPLPADTSVYRIPETVPRDIGRYLAISPQIDSRDAKIRMLAKELTADKETAWEQVAAIYEWVKENIKHSNDPLQGTSATLKEKKGGHEDLAGLFIALCRASKIPARIVWVPGYCYAEFYLETADQDGRKDEDEDQDEEEDKDKDKGKGKGKEEEAARGEWFPCEFKEKTEFALLSQPYMILQKGDNFKVPEAKERKRFVPEFVRGKVGSPVVTVVRETK
jgi:hypothetical protein